MGFDKWNFEISYVKNTPVYRQIMDEIKFLILSSSLKEEEKLLPIRELALRLKVNPNTIVKVYYQLENLGYLYSIPGNGYFVKKSDKKVIEERKILLYQMSKELVEKAYKMSFSEEETIATLIESFKMLKKSCTRRNNGV